ncbi:DUF6326 family protein [Mycoplasmatota bacterium zrk1]
MKKTYLDKKIDVKIKIAALWGAMMILYIYNDFFHLFVPGSIQDILDGNMGPVEISQFTLFAAAAMMALPVLMGLFTLLLSSKFGRVLNIVFGILYSAINLANFPGEYIFYMFLGVIQLSLTVYITYLAFKWPKNEQ